MHLPHVILTPSLFLPYFKPTISSVLEKRAITVRNPIVEFCRGHANLRDGAIGGRIHLTIGLFWGEGGTGTRALTDALHAAVVGTACGGGGDFTGQYVGLEDEVSERIPVNLVDEVVRGARGVVGCLRGEACGDAGEG